MQNHNYRHFGAIGFAAVPWAIWYFWTWRWTGHGAYLSVLVGDSDSHAVMRRRVAQG